MFDHFRRLSDIKVRQLFALFIGALILFRFQCSGNVSKSGIDTRPRGQNLSGRPYLSGYANGITYADQYTRGDTNAIHQ